MTERLQDINEDVDALVVELRVRGLTEYWRKSFKLISRLQDHGKAQDAEIDRLRAALERVHWAAIDAIYGKAKGQNVVLNRIEAITVEALKKTE